MMSKKKESDDNLNLNIDPEIEDSSTEDSEDVVWENVEEQSEKAEEFSKEAEELNFKYMRLAADFKNFRRRAEKEKSDIYAYANEKIVVELLDVIDNFERALEHSKDNTESFAEGMGMIFKQFKGVLEKNGVEEINAFGEPFDPNYHHAMFTEKSAEYESGNVTQVWQKGYMLNNKVIRPAMVKVAE